MGMGKSGHVGRKIAATFLHRHAGLLRAPAEASHGDLGMIALHDDVVLAISNSGESDELVTLLPVLQRQGVRLIAITGRAGSTLAQHADHTLLDSAVDQETRPLSLAPTQHHRAQLALGDAGQWPCSTRAAFAKTVRPLHPWRRPWSCSRTCAS